MSTLLDSLKQYTKVVADTGDFEQIKQYEPQDATTNPTLIYKAVQMEAYQELLEKAIADNEESDKHGDDLAYDIIDDLLILFGCEILKIIPGRVSTEVDAHLSFDTEGTIEKGRKLIKLYEQKGIERERILIKIASTWEGIRAAEVLEQEGIHCNMTLMFSLAQAAACAEAGATLISPFVGRIYDWYKKDTGQEYTGQDDPGVQSVTSIYNYYKKFGYKTEVMGASFRKVDQIIELAGCDLLTISTDLLKTLASTEGNVDVRLTPEAAKDSRAAKVPTDEKAFRWDMNEDAMATEKTAEGIRKFAADGDKLADMIEDELFDD